MASDRRHTFTDDEAAALAIELPGVWRAPLITVDEQDPSEVARAVLRGRRSLFVRDLLDDDLNFRPQLDELVGQLRGGITAALQFVDEAGDWLPDGVTAYLYGGLTPHQSEVGHVMSAAGVHYFSRGARGERWDALLGLCRHVQEIGFESAVDTSQPVAILLSVKDGEKVRTARIDRGSVTAGVDGRTAQWATVDDCVDWLLGLAAVPAG